MPTDPREMLPELWFDCYISVPNKEYEKLAKDEEIEIGYSGSIFALGLYGLHNEIQWKAERSMNRPAIYHCSTSLTSKALQKLSEKIFIDQLVNIGHPESRIPNKSHLIPFLEHHLSHYSENHGEEKIKRNQFANLIQQLYRDALNDESKFSKENKDVIERWIKNVKRIPTKTKHQLSHKARMALLNILGFFDLELINGIEVTSYKAELISSILGMDSQNTRAYLTLDQNNLKYKGKKEFIFDKRTLTELIIHLKRKSLIELSILVEEKYEKVIGELFE